MAARSRWKRWTAIVVIALIVLVGTGGALVWWKFFKSGRQEFSGDDAVARFGYGSLDGELLAGIPYPIFMILPRVFPDLVAKYATERYGSQTPGFGGYGAFGLAGAEGPRLPVRPPVKPLGSDP